MPGSAEIQHFCLTEFINMMEVVKIMPRESNIKKVLVIGSGPIVIGQAAEFDYAGTQACRSLERRRR